jgi:cupin fold WbuC family metalloprotein
MRFIIGRHHGYILKIKDMEKIYSKIEEDVLLAIIVPFQDFDRPRNEIVPPQEFLQGAAIRVNEGDRFRPHKHIWKDGVNKTKAQECWIVIKGLIKIIIYDTDDTIIHTSLLQEGNAVFLLHGGHTFECLEDHTCVWELKTGPYEGQARDKVFINQ